MLLPASQTYTHIQTAHTITFTLHLLPQKLFHQSSVESLTWLSSEALKQQTESCQYPRLQVPTPCYQETRQTTVRCCPSYMQKWVICGRVRPHNHSHLVHIWLRLISHYSLTNIYSTRYLPLISDRPLQDQLPSPADSPWPSTQSRINKLHMRNIHTENKDR